MTPPPSIKGFIQAHQNDDISGRAIRIIGGQDLQEEVTDGEVFLNDRLENPGRAFRIGVVYGAMRTTGLTLNTIMLILGDSDEG